MHGRGARRDARSEDLPRSGLGWGTSTGAAVIVVGDIFAWFEVWWVVTNLNDKVS